MQTVLGFDSFECGLGFFPLTICTFWGAVKVPQFVKKYGDYKTLFAGIILMVAGFSMLVFADAKRGHPALGATGLAVMVRLSEHAADAEHAFKMSMTAALVFTAAILPVVFARKKGK